MQPIALRNFSRKMAEGDFKSLKTRNARFCDEMRGGRIKSLWLKVCHHRKMTNKAFQDLFQSLDGEVKRSFQQIDCDILVLEVAQFSTLSPSGSLRRSDQSIDLRFDQRGGLCNG